MAADRFVSEIHPVSGLGAVLEEDDGASYLYLTLGTGKIVGHVFAYHGSGDASFTFRWSGDGRSVALVVRDQPIAFILHDEAVGYGRNISKEGPMGSPWEEAKYESAFRRN
jgi:hypothetical protein